MARPGLTGHRKFRRLARALGSPIVARGVLELLWDHCYESGDDYIGTAEDIEAIVGWTAERGALTRALADAGFPEGHGFIEPDGSWDAGSVLTVTAETAGQVRFRVHDLWHHAPDYVRKRRERELARLQKVDPARVLSADRPSSESRGAERRRTAPILDWQDGDVRPPSPSPSPPPSPSPVVGESAEPLRDSPPAADEVLLTFSTVGPSRTWDLHRSHLERLVEDYPNVDVHAECRKARAWIDANPNRRKTPRGMAAFLVGWLNRAVDSPRRVVPINAAATGTHGRGRTGVTPGEFDGFEERD